jgi:uncharacterized coiled-coil protein SlyX
MPRPVKSLLNYEFGSWVVIGKAKPRLTKPRVYAKTFWIVQCTTPIDKGLCGNVREIEASHLKSKTPLCSVCKQPKVRETYLLTPVYKLELRIVKLEQHIDKLEDTVTRQYAMLELLFNHARTQTPRMQQQWPDHTMPDAPNNKPEPTPT